MIIRRSLLLIYSFSPGISKFSGNQTWFGVGLLLFFIYLFLFREKKVRERNHIVVVAIWGVIIYAGLLALLLLLTNNASNWLMLVGAISFLVPLGIVATSSFGLQKQLLKDLPMVACAHAVVALLIFSPIRPNIDFLNSIADTLLDGVLAFRLASVSGSLGMSTLMIAVFPISISYYLRYSIGTWNGLLAWFLAELFLICGFLTMQRSAWVSLLFVLIIAYAIARHRRRKIFGLVALPLVLLLISVSMTDIKIDDSFIEVVLERFLSLVSADESHPILERSAQWVNAWRNFYVMPLGYGPGQLGQFTKLGAIDDSSAGEIIFDGDYFRIVSEYGIGGLFLIIIIMISVIKGIINLVNSMRYKARQEEALISAGMLCLVLQGFGTNVTDMYFVNVIYWSFLTLQWRPLNFNAHSFNEKF